MGIAFHTATQFRRAIYTNVPFMVLLFCQLTMIGWITLGPVGFMKDVLEISSLDFYFRVIIIGTGLGNGFLTILYEQIIQRTLGKKEMEKKIEFEIGKKTNRSHHSHDRFSMYTRSRAGVSATARSLYSSKHA